MNKVKRIMTPIMALVLVLCIGYFSGMSKTSAWFYDSGVIDSGDRFVFGNLSVNTKFVINHSVIFDAATKLADKNEIVGGTSEENAKITLGILKGKIKGAKRDIVLLNAGCALYIAGKADNISEGINLAKASIDGGWAYSKLQQLIEYSNKY